jgi:hypothetical protein
MRAVRGQSVLVAATAATAAATAAARVDDEQDGDHDRREHETHDE